MRIFRDVQAMLTALCGLFLVLSLVVLIPGLEPYRHPALPILSVVFGSYFALKAAARAVQDRRLDVNILMVLAAAGAIVVGHVEDAAALLFLFSLSSTLEHMAMAKTQSAIESLIKLRPDTAIRVVDGGDEMVPTESLRVGDVVRVLPFQQIPADGTMLQAHASIDESAMTGESTAIEKQEGDRLMAGTQNLDSMLTMRVSAEVGESTLEKIVAIVQEAQENKASGERISQWFGQTYTIFVVACFLVSLGVRWMLGGSSAGFDWMGQALYPSLILLVALSPCAVVISTPASTLSALAYAARRGILVRGGEFIEIAGTIRVVALDKTGTLTEGRPALVGIDLASGMDESDALRIAASLESRSEHPLADAIVSAANAKGLSLAEPSNFDSPTGKGVVGLVEGQKIALGAERFMDELAIDTSPLRALAERRRADGATAIYLAVEGGVRAVFSIADPIKASTPDALNALREAGLHIVMATGDNRTTAEAIARSLGIKSVEAEVLPAQKADIVKRLIAEGRVVAMAGDGVNDAPALAAADVGIAMGTGTDVAIESAGVTLLKGDLVGIVRARTISRATMRNIRQNLFFAFAYNAAGIPIAAGVLYPLTGALLSPMIAAGAMALSSVSVIANSLRLNRAA